MARSRPECGIVWRAYRGRNSPQRRKRCAYLSLMVSSDALCSMISSRQKSKDWRDKDVAVRPLWSGRPYGAACEPRDGSSDCGDRRQYMRDDVACVWARGSGSLAWWRRTL
jgi:hypothetical protein